jgi:hypothetical protein
MRNKRLHVNAISAWAGLALAAIPVAGCAMDDAAGPEAATGEAQQAASAGGFWEWSRHGNLPVSSDDVDMGSSANQSCFLAGVGGDLTSHNGAPEPAHTLLSIAFAGVSGNNNGVPGNGDLFLGAETGGPSENLRARAMCLSDAADRSTIFGYDPIHNFRTGPTQMVPDDGTHVCFLRALINDDQSFNPGYFSSASDQIHIFSLNGFWWLGGDGAVRADAQCIRVQADLGEWNAVNGTVNLAQNDLNPGTQCFLTGFKGALRSTDFANGAFISYQSGLLQYQLTASSGKGAWARCVK